MMRFFKRFFRKPNTARSAAVFDIRTDAVVGACVLFLKGGPPSILYVRTVEVAPHSGEHLEKAVVRSHASLCTALLTEGGPVLMRATGSGRPDSIVLSLSAPWQRTTVRTVEIDEREPFTFTKRLAHEAIVKPRVPKSYLLDEQIVGASLNGYETQEPFGKRATRATVVLATSLIEEPVAKEALKIVREAYHFHEAVLFANTLVHFQAIRKVFPHEHDALLLDATGPGTDIALVRRGVLSATAHTGSTVTSHAWTRDVQEELANLGRQSPLPRALFVLAKEAEGVRAKQHLERARLERAWLSATPPRIISVLPSHVAGHLRQDALGADLELLLLTLFLRDREEMY